MSLAFLSKKSWHTSNLRNVEKVWLAEQKHEKEQKRLQELRQQIEEERQVEELRDMQRAAGHVSKKTERLDWMYDGPAQSSLSTEEYLLGKEYTGSQSASDVQKVEAQPGALWLNKPSANETFARLNEDPMMMIRRQQQKTREDILKNPVKMQRLREQLLRDKHTDKKKKKKSKKSDAKKDRKERKDRKKDRKKEKSRKRSRSNDDSNEALARTSVEERGRNSDAGSSRKRTYREITTFGDGYSSGSSRRTLEQRDRRHRSPAKKSYESRRDRRDSPTDASKRYRRERRRSRSRSKDECDKARVDTIRNEKGVEHSRRERENDSRYGLVYGRKSSDAPRALGPTEEMLKKVEERKAEAEKTNVRPRQSYRGLSPESKKRLLEDMQRDAGQNQELQLQRLRRSRAEDERESTSSTGKSKETDPKFLRDMNKDVYMGKASTTMEERVARNRYYLQKDVEE